MLVLMLLATGLARAGSPHLVGIEAGEWGRAGAARGFVDPALGLTWAIDHDRLRVRVDALASRSVDLAWTTTTARLGALALASVGPGGVRMEIGGGPVLAARSSVVRGDDGTFAAWRALPGVRAVVGLAAPFAADRIVVHGHLGVATAGLALEHEVLLGVGFRP